MNKLGRGGLIVIIVVILLLILGWGFIGGQQAQKVGITCDMGIGDSLCWKWHTNIIGQIQEGIEDTGNAVKNFFNGSE